MKVNKILETPSKVRTALIVLYSSFGIMLIRFLVEWMTSWSSTDTFEKAWSGFMMLTTSCITILLIYMIGKGKNWARIALLVPAVLRALLAILVVVGLLSGPLVLSTAEIGIELCYVAERILEIIALIFLFQQVSSIWFKSMKFPFLQGVSIVGFNQESSAREAGMQKGDIIIEYAGFRGLTSENLPEFIAKAKPELVQPRVVFVRVGHEYSLSLPPGPLGISAMDATIPLS